MNDSMGAYIALEVIKLMMRKNLKIIDSNVLILGFTFKENCPDIRNTRVIDIFNELKNFDINVEIYDPWVNDKEVEHEFNILKFFTKQIKPFSEYSAIVLAVAHDLFQNIEVEKNQNLVIYDVKSILPKNMTDGRL
jgi:UDP-N-acetyl-D-galactosamine dehydrogenase